MSTANPSFDFETFLEGWLYRQQNYYLEQLLGAQVDIQNKTNYELNTLVSQVLDHYQQYYRAKSIAAHEDVFNMFAPPWFSPFEHSFLWIGGFKPCLTFKIMTNSVDDLSKDQLLRIERLRSETRAAESELGRELARVQESLALAPLVELAGKPEAVAAAADDDDQEEKEAAETLTMMMTTRRTKKVEEALQSVREAMEGLVASADYVRMTTARKVVEILSPVQAVKFLTAATQLQLKIRSKGLQREAEMNHIYSLS